jgi:hypothetical protein
MADGISIRALEQGAGIADIAWDHRSPGAVNRPRDQIIELQLAETGMELRPAVEAAQYARVIDHAAPASVAEEEALTRFLEAFSTCAEAWEELQIVRRTSALAGLSAQLEALQQCGLYVHWAAISARLAAAGGRVTLPLAVLTISRSNLPEARVQLRDQLEIAPEGGPTAH